MFTMTLAKNKILLFFFFHNQAGTLSGLNGHQFSLREDNLVNMSRQSRSQSSLSPENTSKKKSKKKKEGKKSTSDKKLG